MPRSSRTPGLPAVSPSAPRVFSGAMSPHSTASPSSGRPGDVSGSSSSEMSPRVTRSQSTSSRSNAKSSLAEEQLRNAEMAAHVDLSSEDEDLTDTGSDFEETISKRPRRLHRPPLRDAPVSKRPRRERDKGNATGGDLFEAIKQGKSAMEILVDEWLDSYKLDRESGLLELINFLMEACGCKGVVTQEMVERMQNAEIIHKMTEECDEDTADYPLSLTSQPWKKFRQNFGEFLETLVSRCQYSIIYDEFLMDAFISFVTGLSDSQVRAFRHTSSFAAMKLMTGLVKVARNLSVHLETSQRQYDAEKAKRPEKRAPEKLETLLRKQRDLHGNLEEIGNMMNGLFKGVFVHRYRDVVPDIRAFCMEELVNWIRTHSQSFLNDSYMKYVGWTLHDKGHVRLQCVRSLQSLYAVQEMTGRLELFTSRFKDRMVSMVLDKEQQVAVEAIKLLELISKNMENVLTKEDCETVYPLVYASNRSVSTSAGKFLYHRLLETDGAELSTKDRSRCAPRSVFFKLLAAFFIESELHKHAAYLVDGLWECARPQLRDWECQTDLLLLEIDGMDDKQESALIEILVSSLRQAAEGTSPVGRVPARKVPSAKEKKIQSEDKVRLTRHMIVTLPQLLAKFSADPEKVTLLLTVTWLLELEMFYTERLEKHLDLLLIQVRDILEKHTETDVLEACTRALYVLCNQEQTVYKQADITRSHLVDQLTDQLSQQLSDILQVSDLDEDEVYNMAATMKRISFLYSSHDLSRWELFEPVSRVLRRGIDTGEVPEQILVPALACCHFSLLWNLERFSRSRPSQDDLAALRQRLCLFCEMCQSCLSDYHAAVREQAFILISDLLIIFGGHMARGERSHLQPLVYRPDSSLQAELAGFLLDHVFIEPEDEDGADEAGQISLLHNRRNLLAGYCKLVVYSVLQLRWVSDVFRHYVKFYTDYGDIIKETLHKSRSINKEESTRTLLLSLTQAYTALFLEENTPPQRTSRSFLEIRELARRFSLLFGPDQLRNRQDVVLLHKEGIKFALRPSPGSEPSPQNLIFLDVLSEFSPKLLKQDKGFLLQYLDQTRQLCLPQQQGGDADELWAPFVAYQKSLQVESESSPTTPSRSRAQRDRVRSRPPASLVTPPSKRKRKSKDAVVDSSVITEGGGKRPLPLMTSTLLKERKAPAGPAREEGEESADSEAEFEPSQSIIVRRHLGTSSSLGRLQTRTGTPGTLSSSLHRLTLMEEEDEDEEIVIEEVESSSPSPEGEERPIDLLDSAILDSEVMDGTYR